MNDGAAKKRHVNIPIFVPHAGCPHACVFCDQKTITGAGTPAGRDVRNEIETALSTVDSHTTDCEIAFFGGSFTGIDKSEMLRLLETAYSYVQAGRVTSLRLSTRPDMVGDEVLTLLKQYDVRHIELGIQSTDDKVLALCGRGHTAACSKDACERVVRAGFSLTGQMMVGLPGSTPESEARTAKDICDFGADSARIYPTVVFYGTELCRMCERGEYTPLTNEEAAQRAAAVYAVFVKRGVSVLRVGLQAGEGLSEAHVYGGASHSAMGELAIARYYFDLLREACAARLLRGDIASGDRVSLTVFCAPGEASKVAGQKKANKESIAAWLAKRNVCAARVGVLENESVKKHALDVRLEKADAKNRT